MSARTRWTLAVLLLAALAFVGALNNEFVNWDDGYYIVNNTLVTDPGSHSFWQRLTTPTMGYPLPLVMAIYGALWSFTHEPAAFHLLGLTLHLVCVWLVHACVLAELTRPTESTSDTSEHSAAPTKVHLRIASVAALAFAVHPIVVEPVVWATGLKDMLLATGCLVGAFASLHARRTGSLIVGLAIGCLLALLAKPSGVLVGLGLALFALRPTAGPQLRRAALAICSLALVAGLALAVYTLGNESADFLTSTGAPSPRAALAALGLTLTHLLVPTSVSVRYPSALSSDPLNLVLGLIVLVSLALLGWRWRAQKDPRLAWLVLALALWLPASNLLRELIRFTADSYVYLPWACVCVVLALSHPQARSADAPAPRAFTWVPLGLLLLWTPLTLLRIEVWSDTVSLWQDGHEQFPDDGESVYRLGDALGRAGHPDLEFALYAQNETALRQSKRLPWTLPDFLGRKGKLDAADEWWAIAFASEQRQDAELYGAYLNYLGEHPERHSLRHDAALAHAFSLSRPEEFSAAARQNLAMHAARVGHPEFGG